MKNDSLVAKTNREEIHRIGDFSKMMPALAVRNYFKLLEENSADPAQFAKILNMAPAYAKEIHSSLLAPKPAAALLVSALKALEQAQASSGEERERPSETKKALLLGVSQLALKLAQDKGSLWIGENLLNQVFDACADDKEARKQIAEDFLAFVETINQGIKTEELKIIKSLLSRTGAYRPERVRAEMSKDPICAAFATALSQALEKSNEDPTLKEQLLGEIPGYVEALTRWGYPSHAHSILMNAFTLCGNEILDSKNGKHIIEALPSPLIGALRQKEWKTAAGIIDSLSKAFFLAPDVLFKKPFGTLDKEDLTGTALCGFCYTNGLYVFASDTGAEITVVNLAKREVLGDSLSALSSRPFTSWARGITKRKRPPRSLESLIQKSVGRGVSLLLS